MMNTSLDSHLRILMASPLLVILQPTAEAGARYAVQYRRKRNKAA